MPSSTTFRSDSTFTQRTFRRWVDTRPMSDINRYELIHGRIVMTPPAGWLHGSVEANIVALLQQHVRRHHLGIVFGSSVGYDLPSKDTLEPDASFVSARRFAETPPARPQEFLRAVPSLVVEILSPATSRRDRTEKKHLYETNGVDEYWVVDARHLAVTVFGLDADRYDAGRTVIAGCVRSRVLPKLRVSVAKIFQR
jgi:Uma2 family endonuclease